MVVVFDKNHQTCIWEIVGELQQSDHVASCLVSQPRLREDFRRTTIIHQIILQVNNYLEWVIGIEPTSMDLQSSACPTGSTHIISGTASRNRTHIRRVEAYCILHYTIAVLVRVARIELARPKPRDFKSLVSTYFTILAVTLLYLKQSCKSTVGTSSEIRTHI